MDHFIYTFKREIHRRFSLAKNLYNSDISNHPKENNGERMQYYVENTHPAIISKDIFNAAQKLMRERSKRNASDLIAPDTPFRQRMVCGIAVRRSDCGEIEIGHIGPANCTANRVKMQHSQIDEQEIMATFCRLYYKLKHHGGSIFTQCFRTSRRSVTAGCSGART